MEVKVLVVGATTVPKKLAASARKRGGRFWIALPSIIDDEGDTDELVDRTAKKLGGDARVIEVEMSTGMRGEDVRAWTYIAPGREDEMDLTEIAAEILEDWGGSAEEEIAAQELAWALVDVLAKAMEEVS